VGPLEGGRTTCPRRRLPTGTLRAPVVGANASLFREERTTGYSRKLGRNGRREKPVNFILTLDKRYTVSVGISDEEDTGAAAHSVRLALEVHAASFLEPLGESVEVLDGESDVAVAFAQSVGFFATVV
jgi:hypothetical protein